MLSLVSVLGGYKDTVLAHKLLAGARLHQATHALIGLFAVVYKDTVLAHKLLAGAGSIRQHTLSLVNAGKYSDTMLAHKLLAGARLHQATHALIGQCRKIFRHNAGT
jgi:hypothetical protein